MMLLERRLHGMERVAVGHALDGEHVRALRLDREHGAGLHALAVDVHVARPALAGVAADMGAGEAEIVAQKLDEQGAGGDLARHLLAVDGHADLRLGHAGSPQTRCSPLALRITATATADKAFVPRSRVAGLSRHRFRQYAVLDGPSQAATKLRTATSSRFC